MRRMLLVLTAAAIIAALMATSAYAQITPEDEQEAYDNLLPPCAYQDSSGNWVEKPYPCA
jgi:hypothetical protein